MLLGGGNEAKMVAKDRAVMTNERKKAWWIRDPDRDEKTDRKKPNDAERRKNI